MNFDEILEEVPKLTFAQRQELVRVAMAEDDQLSEEEMAVLDGRIEQFCREFDAGVPLGQ